MQEVTAVKAVVYSGGAMRRTRVRIGSWVIGAALALPAAALAQEAYTTTAVNLRAGPDADYPLVRWVPEGTAVQVVGCLGDFLWCDVEVFGDRGWMYAKYLVYPYQSNYVPIVSYGPVIGVPIFGFSIDYWDDHYRGRPWYSDRPRWVHRHRPEYYPPQHRPPQYRPPQYYPPGNRPEFRPPGVRPDVVRPDVSPPLGPPSYRPPQARPAPRPEYRPPDVTTRPQPVYRPPDVSRPAVPAPSMRPPGPSARPPAPSVPPQIRSNRPLPGRDPYGVRDNAGERGGMTTGNF